jgi:hypothetical protein
VAEHQETDRAQPQIASDTEVLDGDVSLGAVGCDTHHGHAHVGRGPHVVDRAQAGEQKAGNARVLRLAVCRLDQRQLVLAGEAVVEAGPSEAVPVRHLDHRDTGRVERADRRADLVLGQLVRHGVAAVAQC